MSAFSGVDAISLILTAAIALCGPMYSGRLTRNVGQNDAQNYCTAQWSDLLQDSYIVKGWFCYKGLLKVYAFWLNKTSQEHMKYMQLLLQGSFF